MRPPEKLLSLKELKKTNLKEVLEPADLEVFLSILSSKYPRNEDPSEHAFSWLLNAQPIGKKQTRLDLITQGGEGLSVKSFHSRRNVKVGRVGSSDAYKKLTAFMYFHSAITNQDVPTGSFSKSYIEELDLGFLDDFVESIHPTQQNLETFYRFQDAFIKTNEDLAELVNKIFYECFGEVDHILILNKSNLNVLLIEDFNKRQDFFQGLFYRISGNEMWIKVDE